MVLAKIRPFRLAIGSCLLTALGLLLPGIVLADNNAPQVQIGVVRSVFRDIPPQTQRLMMLPFSSLMYAQTGINGRMVLVDDAFQLADKLEKNEVQLGVFHGFEFAWVQAKNPKLKPLMIAVNRNRKLSAQLVVHKNSPIRRFEDLKSNVVALPMRSREHCWLYMERNCARCGLRPRKFFRRIRRHPTMEDALDDVVRGEVDGIIVDGVSLDCYRQIKPGAFRHLRVVEKSPDFPAAVIVYRDGRLSDDVLNRFRKGMLSANQNVTSRQLMMLCKLTGFEEVPEDYQATLANIRRVYPPPILGETSLPDDETSKSR